MKSVNGRTLELFLHLWVLRISALVRVCEWKGACNARERFCGELDGVRWARLGRDLEHRAEDDTARDSGSEGSV